MAFTGVNGSAILLLAAILAMTAVVGSSREAVVIADISAISGVT